MGIYIYRVSPTPRTVMLDGSRVNIHTAAFAYKPYGRAKYDDRLHARTVGPAQRKWDQKPSDACKNVLVAAHGIVEGGEVYRFDYMLGSYCDAALGEEGYRYVGKLTKRGKRWTISV